jgi:hypothetical protein
MFAVFTPTGLAIGLTLTGIGIAMVKFSFQLLNATGPQQWLERFTGQGTTNGMYKILGCVLVIGGILTATGFGDNVMNFLLTPLYNVFAPLRGLQ